MLGLRLIRGLRRAMASTPVEDVMGEEFTWQMIKSASDRIHGHINETPIIQSNYFNTTTGFKVYMKAENFQKTGSFKARGALNAIKVLQNEKRMDERRFNGVVTHSSGNHGQALAWAARAAGVPCTVVVPNNAPKVKQDAVADYGAKIVFCESTMKAREETAAKLVEDEGLALIHPHDDLQVMAGQGTIAMEILQQMNHKPDAILIPTGGGGMTAGIATWMAHLSPQTKVFCVVPACKDLETSLAAGKPLWEGEPCLVETIADGIRPDRLGFHCFPPIVKYCQKNTLPVTEEQIVTTMKMSWERLKMVVESSSAVGLAALFQPRLRELLGPGEKRVCVVLCGGNVDLDHLPWIH